MLSSSPAVPTSLRRIGAAIVTSVALALGGIVGACSDNGNGMDAGVDTGTDTGVDTGADTGADTGPNCAAVTLTSVGVLGSQTDGGAGDASVADAGDGGKPPPSVGLCAAGGTLVLTGTGFAQGAVVTAGGRTATKVTVSADRKQAIATFGAGAPASPVNVTITNPEGCSASAP